MAPITDVISEWIKARRGGILDEEEGKAGFGVVRSRLNAEGPRLSDIESEVTKVMVF